jgi:hypothetical protein
MYKFYSDFGNKERPKQHEGFYRDYADPLPSDFTNGTADFKVHKATTYKAKTL